MNCPYCAEDIKDDAIVCRYCHHDVGPSRVLMAANAELVAKVRKLEGEVAELRSRLPIQSTATAVVSTQTEVKLGPPSVAEYVFQYFAFAVIALLASHYLIVMKFDLNPLYLRIVSILIPLPFGFMLYRRTVPSYAPTLVIASLVGTFAVGGMLAVIGFIDNVSIIPADMREWRETVEYVVSIALALILGAMISSRFIKRATSDGHNQPLSALSKRIATLLGIGEEEKAIGQKMEKIEKLLNSGIATATAAGSVFAGVRAVFF